MVKSLSLLFLLVLVAFVASQDVQYVQGVLRDQAPDTMKLCTAVTGLGSAGTANNSYGFVGTDFQLPIGYYKDNEKGLVGPECNVTNQFTNCGKIGADRTPVYAFTGMSPWKNIHSPATFYRWFHDSDQTINKQFSVPLTLDSNNVYSYSNSSFFPLDNQGWGDYCADAGTPKKNHNYAYCFEAHFRFGYRGGEVFKFTGDDDVWVYINDLLVIDLGALHTELSKTLNVDDIVGLVKSTPTQSSSYRFDFFYCERHTTESNMKISTSLVVYCAYTDWCGVCEGNGQSCCSQALIDKYCNDKNPCTIDTCGVQIPPASDGCVHIPINCTAPDACHVAQCNNATGLCEMPALNCDDFNACTTDSCSLTVGCQHPAISCDDNNKCTTDSCDKVNGCQHATVSCDDGNPCTVDSCSASTGCSYIPLVCNANNKCLQPTCGASGCSTTPISCDDSNACTTDSCIPATGCSNVVVKCDDNNACTTDTCDKTTGCGHAPVVCNDNNDCTTDSCAAASGCSYQTVLCASQNCKTVQCKTTGGCQYTNVTCNDMNPCTTDSCDVNTNQCSFKNIDCNDNAACTDDACVAGKCSYTPVSCDDKNACTLDTCSNTTKCSSSPISCDDSNACTDDSCNPATGCVHVSTTCNDFDACTTDSCDPKGGCQFTKISCDDKKACTKDTCDKLAGCQNTPIVCDDKSACTVDSCDNTTGCVYATKNCDDLNACTNDTCDPASGCAHTDISSQCEDGSKCTVDGCDKAIGCTRSTLDCSTGDGCILGTCSPSAGCQNSTVANCSLCSNPATGFKKDCTVGVTDLCNPKVCTPVNGTCIPDTPVSCNDSSACTTDSCNSVDGKCVFTPLNCDDNNKCTIDTCNKLTGCAHKNVVCNDNSVCTNDTCNGADGSCLYTNIPCDDNNLCTVDTCDSVQGCNFTAVVCDDGSKCTTEVCNSGTGKCDFTPVNCDDNIACTIDSCNATAGCIHVNKICNDANACTQDSCSTTTGNCTFAAIPCNAPDLCHIAACDKTTGCNITIKMCDDNNPCTQDSCTPATGVCVFAPIAGACAPCGATACPWTDSCAPQVCDNSTTPNTCKPMPVVCDDHSVCTKDTCMGSGAQAVCNYADIPCNTSDPCNLQVCDPVLGCVAVPHNCDDSNPCTDDSCVAVGGNATCQFIERICTTNDLCSPATCDKGTGQCTPAPIVCDDGNNCTDDACYDGNCTYTLRTCSTDSCNPAVCNETDGQCYNTPVVCDDGNPCTVDSVQCDATTSNVPLCVHVTNATVCDDGNSCTTDYCDSSVPTGENPCRNTETVCPTTDACTVSLGCIPGVGCSTKPLNCGGWNDTISSDSLADNSTDSNSTSANQTLSDYCKIASCDKVAGCIYENRICENKDIGCFNSVCNSTARQCITTRKSNFGSAHGKGGIVCPLLYDDKAKKAAIASGAVAGIVIGAVAAAALAGVGGKAGYDYLMAKNSPIAAVAQNPLYTPAASSGQNQLYGGG